MANPRLVIARALAILAPPLKSRNSLVAKKRVGIAPASRVAISKTVVAAIVIIVVAVGGVAAFEVISNTAPPNSGVCGASAASGQAPVQVSIYNGSASPSDPPGYTPDVITVVIGVNSTVIWTNNDSIHHTVTSTSAPTGGSFNSGNMQPGTTCTHTFSVPGTYQYDCIYHSWMTGTVIVKASS